MVSKFTHAAAGYFTGILFGLNPVYTLAGALLPDLDTICCHRKILHNLWVSLAVFYFGGFPLFAGYLSHLVLDSLTPWGVNWFYPLPAPKLRGPVRTGSLADYILGVVFLILSALVILGYIPPLVS